MKNVFFGIAFGIMFAVTSFAQTVAGPAAEPQSADKSTKPRLAVLEFTGTANNPSWNSEMAATLQRNLVKELTGTLALPTEEGTKVIAVVRGGKIAQAASATEENAVKVGKLLGVNYVLFGEVKEYRPGVIEIEVSLFKLLPTARVKVRLSPVRHLDPSLAKHGTGTLTLNQATEKVMKPVIQQLTASIKAADL